MPFSIDFYCKSELVVIFKIERESPGNCLFWVEFFNYCQTYDENGLPQNRRRCIKKEEEEIAFSEKPHSNVHLPYPKQFLTELQGGVSGQ